MAQVFCTALYSLFVAAADPDADPSNDNARFVDSLAIWFHMGSLPELVSVLILGVVAIKLPTNGIFNATL
jgi:hypothetical protein